MLTFQFLGSRGFVFLYRRSGRGYRLFAVPGGKQKGGKDDEAGSNRQHHHQGVEPAAGGEDGLGHQQRQRADHQIKHELDRQRLRSPFTKAMASKDAARRP